MEIIVKEVQRVNDVSLKAFPCPKVNDKGLSGAWWWADKIAIAVALWATYETWKAAKEEYRIGKAYYNLAKEQWDFFYKHYRPLEEQELDEIWEELPYEPDYDFSLRGHVDLVDNVHRSAEKHREALARAFCVCYDVSQFTRAELAQSTIYGDLANFSRRYAEKLAQEKNDIRWSRRINAAARGRGLLTTSAQFAGQASDFLNKYAQAMGGVAGGAMQFSGYTNHRQDTAFNTARTRINSRTDVPNAYRGTDHNDYWQKANLLEHAPRGGLESWGQAEARAHYIQSGFDPAQFARTAPAV